MKVINWKPYNKGKLRGFFDVLTAEGFTIKGFKIMEGINGEFVSRPSQQDKDGEWFDTVYCTREMSDKILVMVKAIKTGYERQDNNEIGQAPETAQPTDNEESIPF